MQEQWIPNRQFLNDANLSWLEVAGRLKPAVSPAEAQVNLSVIAARLDAQSPPRSTTIYVDRATLMNNPRARGAVLGAGAVVLAAVSLVLLIACANLANLLLARGTARQKEIALRLAVGASRVRVIRQLLTESLLLAFAGGAAGLLAAWATLGAVGPILMSQLPPEAQGLRLSLSPDVRIVAYSILLSIATAVGFGMIPALQVSRIDLNSALKDSSATFGRASRRWIRGSLVAAQVAVCLILLIAAGLLARGVYAAQNIDPGFRMNDVAVANFDLTLQGYDATRATAFQRGLSERLSSIPGIQDVGFAQPVPLSGDRRGDSVALEGRDGDRSVYCASVSANYFELLDIPILRGRSFRDFDISSNAPAVVLSEAAARKLWPGEEPVGKRLRFGRDTVYSEVIGVAKDLHSLSLSERDLIFVYVPLRPGDYLSASLLARGTASSATMARVIQSEAHGLDGNLLVRTSELKKNLNLWQIPSRVTAVLGLVLGLAGLLLASLGVFGVVAYAVSQRTKEIGIRVSLGAQKNDVLWLMMAGSMRFVISGMVLGLAGSAAVSRILQSLLFGVSPLDPVVFAGVSALLGGVAALASYVPARRATQVDPLTALRHE
jgi:predicted permease